MEEGAALVSKGLQIGGSHVMQELYKALLCQLAVLTGASTDAETVTRRPTPCFKGHSTDRSFLPKKLSRLLLLQATAVIKYCTNAVISLLHLCPSVSPLMKTIWLDVVQVVIISTPCFVTKLSSL